MGLPIHHSGSQRTGSPFHKQQGGIEGLLYTNNRGGGGIQCLLYTHTAERGYRVSFTHKTEEGIQGLPTQATEGMIQGLLKQPAREYRVSFTYMSEGGGGVGMKLLHTQPGLYRRWKGVC
jgi:hypothetical protein